jgi:hypothetical protein
MRNKYLYALSLSLLICFTACSKTETPPATTTEPTPAPAPEPVGVSAGTVTLGKAVGADKRVTEPLEKFAKGDTIYASVDTSGAGTATLKAKWTYMKGGQTTVVNEESQTIMPMGPATTEFHVSKPGGWPAGDYQVEVFLDDKPVGSKTFTIG